MRRVQAHCTASLIDADPAAEAPWYATDYVAGPTLHQQVTQHGALDADQSHALAGAMAEAIDGIHTAGIVHRDLKPANVILADDGPTVLDFGIARALDGTPLTSTGMMVGSLGWSARLSRPVWASSTW